MELPGMLFAYIGPDTLLPVTSGIVGVIGAVLMFGKLIAGRAARWLRLGGRK